MSVESNRDLLRSMGRGWRQKCPACGQGSMYHRYLKVADTCATCSQELHHQRADDAPPYFTMMVVGHIIVAGVLILERAYQPAMWVHAVIWFPLLVLMSLWMLPRIKGSLIGLQWAFKMHGFDGPEDAAAGASNVEPAR